MQVKVLGASRVTKIEGLGRNMIVIVDRNAEAAQRIADLVARFDMRLSCDQATDYEHAWLMARAGHAWMVICNCYNPHIQPFLSCVRTHLPDTFILLTGVPENEELRNYVDGVLYKVTYDSLLPFLRAARARNRSHSTRVYRPSSKRKPPQPVEITAKTGALKFTVPVPPGTQLSAFLAQFGKSSIAELKLFRGGSALPAQPGTVLENGDCVEMPE